MPKYLGTGDMARLIESRNPGWTVPPKAITDAFYQRLVSSDGVLLTGGRRMIPADMVEVIEAALRRYNRTGEKREVLL